MTHYQPISNKADFLKHANFRPVFDDDGKVVDISELDFTTDRRDGIRAMRDLLDTSEANDHLAGADGFTGKQRRILSCPAPLAAHYLRHSKKWDARSGAMRDAALILLPYEVVWELFEGLFFGQYSITVVDQQTHHEEIRPADELPDMRERTIEAMDDAPGIRIYSRARVRISLHLPGHAQSRDFEGVGVSYGNVSWSKSGNVFALNSEYRTVDKGAVNDAKREALSHMGRVFRRAFEDGDEMVHHVEQLLLAKIRNANRPAIHAGTAAAAVAPPKSRKTADQVAAPKKAGAEAEQNKAAQKKDTSQKAPSAQKSPTANASTATSDTPSETTQEEDAAQDKPVCEVSVNGDEAVGFNPQNAAADVFDIALATCLCREDLVEFLERNESVFKAFEIEDHPFESLMLELPKRSEMKADTEADVAEVEKGAEVQTPEAEPDAKTASDTAEVPCIDTKGKSGKAVLGQFLEIIAQAPSSDFLDALIKVNEDAARKMTAKQYMTFVQALADRRTKIEG